MSTSRTLADVGEFGLIGRIAAILGDCDALVGIGDDTAVINTERDVYLLATVDMLLQDVHFRIDAIGGFDLGRRAIAVNVSDIAAMGGRPTYALTSLAAPPHSSLQFVEDLYRGIREEADLFGLSVIGGNTARTHGPLTIDVTMLGEVPKAQLVLRRGSQIGDVLAVTGFLGDAAASRLAVERARNLGEPAGADRPQNHLVPQPRLAAGRALASRHVAHAMMDISDGLGSDVHHLADAGKVGAVIYEERLPITLTTQQVADRLGLNAPDLALYGGEDYELLVALPETSLGIARTALGPLPLHEVGTVLPRDQGVLLETLGGRRQPLPPTGWTHF